MTLRKTTILLLMGLTLTIGAGATPALFNARDFGAIGDGTTKDTKAVQAAIDAAHDNGGGVAYLPPGKYLCGTLVMKDHVTLEVEIGATLLGSTDLDDFPCNQPAFRSYTDTYVCRSLLAAEDATDIAITGRGTIDGQGAAFPSDGPDHGYRTRPYIIRFVSCHKVRIKNVTLRNSPMWMQQYLNCDDLVLDGLTVYNHVNRNNDMIDIDCCRNVRISNCFGTTADDAITLKSTADTPCENVTIANCTVSSNCNAIKMGTESNGGFKNVTVTNCTVSRPENGYFGNRSLSGIALMIVDGGTMERIAISNIAMEGVVSALFIRLGNRARPFKEDMEKPGIGIVRDIAISNVVARNVENTGCFVAGLPDHPIENVSISDMRVTYAGDGAYDGDMWAVPENADQYPEGTMFGVLPAYGFYLRHVNGFTVRNVAVAYAKPDRRPALVCDDAKDLLLDGFQGMCEPDGSPVLALRYTRSSLIRGSIAPRDCPAFLQLFEGCERISVTGNDLSAASGPFRFAPNVDHSVLWQGSNRIR